MKELQIHFGSFTNVLTFGSKQKTHRLHDVFGPLWALSTLHELLLGGIQLSDPVCKFTNNNTPTVKRELMGFYIYIIDLYSDL